MDGTALPGIKTAPGRCRVIQPAEMMQFNENLRRPKTIHLARTGDDKRPGAPRDITLKVWVA
jgi:hypothetical protein